MTHTQGQNQSTEGNGKMTIEFSDKKSAMI